MSIPADPKANRWSVLGQVARQLALRPRATLGKLVSWEAHDEKFRFWLRNEAKFGEWLANEQVIATALHAHRLAVQGPPDFEIEYQAFSRLLNQSGRQFSMNREDAWPCLADRSAQTPFDPHYTYHPAWAARVLARTRPAKHVDISSILSFSVIVSAFVPVEFYDFRPAPVRLANFSSARADLSRLDFPDGSIPSLSSMHVIEHIGLGRYGDPLDPDGDLKAIRELVRVLAPGGDLLVVVPVGRSRIQFNAHRIYDFMAFRDYFAGLELVEFALITDASDGLIYDPPADLVNAQTYGCGCYWFTKPSARESR
jgi:SAM-dependent methyltransferase